MDPAEYNAYIAALNTRDPAAKAAAMEAFVKQYPASIVKIDALEQAMAAYQEAAEKVWNAIVDKEKQGKAKLRIPVKVISSTRFTIDAAITDENQKDSKADLFVILDDPLDPPLIAGSMVDVVGVLTEYQPDPIRFTMRQAQLVRPAK